MLIFEDLVAVAALSPSIGGCWWAGSG